MKYRAIQTVDAWGDLMWRIEKKTWFGWKFLMWAANEYLAQESLAVLRNPKIL